MGSSVYQSRPTALAPNLKQGNSRSSTTGGLSGIRPFFIISNHQWKVVIAPSLYRWRINQSRCRCRYVTLINLGLRTNIMGCTGRDAGQLDSRGIRPKHVRRCKIYPFLPLIRNNFAGGLAKMTQHYGNNCLKQNIPAHTTSTFIRAVHLVGLRFSVFTDSTLGNGVTCQRICIPSVHPAVAASLVTI